MTLRSEDTRLEATLPASDGVAGLDDSPPIFERGAAVGRYTLLLQVGAGAMGVVFAAYDPQLDRKVALKLLKPRGRGRSLSRERLQREAQALAKLGHPNVVAVYDVGLHEDQLFVAMEFVEGQTLGEWMASAPASSTGSTGSTPRVAGASVRPARPRPWREVLEVFMQAGRGLAAAHEAGLVHRDFKPDNVMLSEDGRVRVMDFGLVRVDEDSELDSIDPNAKASALTQTGALLGTPAYMSLEQFASGLVDARSDQFGFCVALHEALYGERPFVGETVGELVFALEEAVVREPLRGAQVPRWVRDVVLRGLAKQPEARFPSMKVLLEALAADPIARRRRRIARISVGLTLLAGSWGVITLSGKVEQRDAKIEEQASELELKNIALEEQLAVQTRLLSAQRGLRASTLVRTGNEAEALLLGVQAVGAYAGAWDETPDEATKGLEQVLAHDTIIGEASHVLEGHEDYLTHVAYAPDGAQLATASFDGSVRLWDPRRAELRATLDHQGGKVIYLAFSPDGTHLATASQDARARIWSAESGELLATLGHQAALNVLAFSPDSNRLATGGMERSVRVWDTQSAELLSTLSADDEGAILDLEYTPDGTRLVTAGADAKARVWDAKTGEPLATLTGHEGRIRALAISSDGTRVATASDDRDARTWALPTGELVATLVGHESLLSDLAYSPDGTRLTTVSWDRTGRIYDPETGTLVATLVDGHGYGITSVAHASSGATLATGSFDGSVVLWDPETGASRARLRGHTADVWSLAFAPDGRQLATASVDHSVRLWRIDETRVAVLEGPNVGVSDFAYSPDRAHLATMATDGRLRLWTGETGEPVLTLDEGHGRARAHIAYAPDGSRLAATSQGLLRSWDPRTGALIATTRVGNSDDDIALHYSPTSAFLELRLQHRVGEDGTMWIHDAHTLERLSTFEHMRSDHRYAYALDDTRLVITTRASNIQLWDPRTGSLATELELPDEKVSSVVHSPDGSEIATFSLDVGIRLWDARRLMPRVPLQGSGDIKLMIYPPDGLQIAGLTTHHEVLLWDVQTGELRLRIAADTEDPRANAVVFADGGSRMAVLGSRLGRTYDRETGRFLAYIDSHGKTLLRAVFSLDGTRLTTLAADHTLTVWDVDTGEPLTQERIGIERDDGSIVWPIPPRELTRIGCTRLQVFELVLPDAQDICNPLLAP